MTKVIRVSISLILIFLFSFATLVHAQPTNTNCKDIAKEMMRTDTRINKIQGQMTRAIESVYEDTAVYFKKQQKPNKKLKRLDRYNRGLNILVLNLEQQVVKMKGLLEEAKKQGNGCQKVVRNISDKVNATQDIHAKMVLSLGDKNSLEHEFQDLIENLNQQAGGNKS
jgi:chromosome segregation ATPase